LQDTGTNITQVVHPHHDFFSAQFLLSFSQGGQYQICITASVIDAEGQVWRTGPKTFLVVKVYEDQSQPTSQVISKNFASTSDASRSAPPLPRF
jgi:integrator complex subunit 7